IGSWLEQQVLHYSLAKGRYNECQSRYLKDKRQQQVLRETLAGHEQSLSLCEQRREDLNQQILDVTARRLGVPALRDKDQLLADKKALEKQIHQSVPDLLQQDQQLQLNSQAAQQIQVALRQTSIALTVPALADKNLQKLARQ